MLVPFKDGFLISTEEEEPMMYPGSSYACLWFELAAFLAELKEMETNFLRSGEADLPSPVLVTFCMCTNS